MRWWISCKPCDWRIRLRRFYQMTITEKGFSATRRLVLQGAGLVALVGLGNVPLGFAPAFAAANDKYPGVASKQTSDAAASKSLYGRTARPSEKANIEAPKCAET